MPEWAVKGSTSQIRQNLLGREKLGSKPSSCFRGRFPWTNDASPGHKGVVVTVVGSGSDMTFVGENGNSRVGDCCILFFCRFLGFGVHREYRGFYFREGLKMTIRPWGFGVGVESYRGEGSSDSEGSSEFVGASWPVLRISRRSSVTVRIFEISVRKTEIKIVRRINVRVEFVRFNRLERRIASESIILPSERIVLPSKICDNPL